MPLFLKHLVLLMISLCFATLLWSSDLTDRSIPPYDEKEVKERLNAISDPLFKPKYNRVVRAYIKGYVLRNRQHSEKLIGRTAQYFPIFETLLKANDMPEALKYLPVVESALRPKALSRVGAGGLWQFMPATAREYGLVIDANVDERFDPHKSTKAAIAYLSRQYEKYESWPLALAAYNGGSGRVSRAIKRGRSRNFWRIKRYLPRETRNYVSAYLAAVYLMEYYEEHNLIPEYPDLDRQITASIQIKEQLSFYKIAQLTGIPLSLIQALNPSYERNFIPSSASGNYIILPKRVIQALSDYLNATRKESLEAHPVHQKPILIHTPEVIPAKSYMQKHIYVLGRKTIDSIAMQLDMEAYHLRVWNAIPNDSIAVADTVLTLFEPQQIMRFNPALPTPPVTPLAVPPTLVERANIILPSALHLHGQMLYYAPTEKIRLKELAARMQGVPLDSLVLLNQLKPKSWVKAGRQIVIRQF